MSQVNPQNTARSGNRWPAGLDFVAIAATWILFLVAIPFLEGEAFSMETLIAAGLIGALVITLGFMATSRVRPPLDRALSSRVRFAALAILTGAAIGVLHLATNLILATLYPQVQARLIERFVQRPAWGSTFAALSVVAWLAFRLMKDRRAAFWVGLLASAALFSLPHLWGRPSGGTGLVAVAYQGMILLNSGVAACVLGWVFWRWGLLPAMVCHFTVNSFIMLIAPLALG